MNLHEVLMEMGKSHVKIKKSGFADLLFFNLKTKTIKNGKTVLVKDGVIVPQKIRLNDGRILELENDWGLDKTDFYNGLEERYDKYYLSVPSKVDRFVRANFIAKNYDKMTFEEIMNPSSNNRNLARYELEWFVMANAVKGNIPWNEEHWYWQSKEFPRLIIYKEYL